MTFATPLLAALLAAVPAAADDAVEVVVGRSHEPGVSAVALDPSGALVATAGGGRVLLWSRDRLVPTKELAVEGEGADVRFVPGGVAVAVRGWDDTFRLVRYELPAGRIASEEEVDGGSLAVLAPDGSAMAAGTNSEVTVLAAGTPSRRATVHMDSPGFHHAGALSPGGRLFALGRSDGKIAVYEPFAQPPPPPRMLEGHAGKVTGVAFAPDGARLASVAEDGTVRLWDLGAAAPTGRVLGTHPRARENATRWSAPNAPEGVAFSADGRRVASLAHEDVRVFELAAGGAPAVLAFRHPRVAAVAPDEVLAAGYTSGLSARPFAGGAERSSLDPGYNAAPDVPAWLGFSPSGALEVLETSRMVDTFQELARWTASGAEPVYRYDDLAAVVETAQGPQLLRRSLDLLPLGANPPGPFDPAPRAIRELAGVEIGDAIGMDSGRLALVADRERERRWIVDVRARRVQRVPVPPSAWKVPAAAQGAGPLVAWSDGEAKRVEVWDARRAVRVWSAAEGGAPVLAARERRLALLSREAWGSGGRLQVWDLARKARLADLPVAASWGAFSPDARRLAVGAGPRLALWDERAPGRVVEVEVAPATSRVRWSPDGERLLVGTPRGEVLLVEAATGRVAWRSAGHPGAVLALALHPSRPLVAASFATGAVAVFSAETGERRALLARFTASGERAVAQGVAAWVAVGPDARFDASREGVTFLSFARGFAPLPAEEVSRRHDPGVLARALGLEPPRPAGPAVRISWPSDRTETAEDQIAVSYELSGAVRSYALTVGGADVVAEVPPARRGGAMVRTASVRLAPGENRIRLVPRDLAGVAQAGPEIVVIRTSADPPPSAPDLVPQIAHAGALRCVAWSPDGRRFATAADDRTVKLWDAASALLIRTLRGLPVAPEQLAFSPDGRRLAARGREEGGLEADRVDALSVWDLETGALAHTFIGRYDGEEARWFGAGADAAFQDHYAKLAQVTEHGPWRAEVKRDWRRTAALVTERETGKLVAELVEDLGDVPAFSPDGALLALADAGGVAFYDTATWRFVRSTRADTDLPVEIGFLDAETVAFRRDARREARLDLLSLRTATVAPLGADLPRPPDGFSGFAVDPRGRRVAYGLRGALSVAEADGKGRSVRLLGPTDFPVAPRFGRGGALLAAVTEDVRAAKDAWRVRLWPAGATKEISLDRPRVRASVVEFDRGGTRLFAAGAAPVRDEPPRLPGFDNPADFVPGPGAAAGDGILWWWSASGGRRSERSLAGCVPSDLAGDPAADRLAIACGDGRVLLWSAASASVERALSLHPGPVRAVRFRPDGGRLATSGENGAIVVSDPATGRIERVLVGHGGAVYAIAWSPDGARLLSAGLDGVLRLWDAASGALVATIVLGGGDDVIVALPSGEYTASKAAIGAVAFRAGPRVVPFDQFDVARNRPDRVLEALRSSDGRLVAAYRAAAERRLHGAARAAGGAPPALDVVSSRVDGRTLRLAVRARAQGRALAALRVRANDVPLPDVAAAGDGVERELAVELEEGPNRVRVVAADAGGAESLPVLVDAAGPPAAQGRTAFVLAIGVSRYRDGRYDLRFAEKDATRLAAALARRREGLARVETRVLADGAATADAIRAQAAFFEAAGPDDLAVVFVAGHGTADGGEYFFAPHDMEFDRPARSGVAFADLEALFSRTRARRRLLLMDTCHAGAIDAEARASVAAGVAVAPGARGIGVVSNERTASFEVMRSLFADLSRGSGALVVAAAGGAQFAFERQGSGVFTGALLESLVGGAADADADGRVTVRELQADVARRVREATAGAQAPAFRRDAIGRDFVLSVAPRLVADVRFPLQGELLGLDARGEAVLARVGSARVSRWALDGLRPLEDWLAAVPPKEIDSAAGVSPDGAFELVKSQEPGPKGPEPAVALHARPGGERLARVGPGWCDSCSDPARWTGRLAAVELHPLGSEGSRIALVSLAPPFAVREIAPGGNPFRVALRPDGKRLSIVAMDGHALVHDLAGGTPVARVPLAPAGAKLHDAALSRDGGRAVLVLTVRGEEQIRVHDLPSGRLVRTVAAAGVDAIALDEAGARLALARRDGSVEVVDVASGEAIARLRTDGVAALALASGDRLVLARPGRLRVWDVSRRDAPPPGR